MSAAKPMPATNAPDDEQRRDAMRCLPVWRWAPALAPRPWSALRLIATSLRSWPRQFRRIQTPGWYATGQRLRAPRALGAIPIYGDNSEAAWADVHRIGHQRRATHRGLHRRSPPSHHACPSRTALPSSNPNSLRPPSIVMSADLDTPDVQPSTRRFRAGSCALDSPRLSVKTRNHC